MQQYFSIAHSSHVSSMTTFEAMGVWRVQDDTPLPTNPNVYLHSTPGSTFYVSQFGGFLVDDITLSAKVGAFNFCWEVSCTDTS